MNDRMERLQIPPLQKPLPKFDTLKQFLDPLLQKPPQLKILSFARLASRTSTS